MQDGCVPFRSADDSLHNTALLKWCELTLEGSSKVGRKWADPRHYKDLMKKVGFVDVTEKLFKWPLGPWPKERKLKELGAFEIENMMQVLSATKKVFTVGLGWTFEDADAFIEKIQGELKSQKVYAWVDM